MATLPGVELDTLRGWLDATHPGLCRGELSGAVIAGGKSNLTYRISDGETTWALRRPPLAHVLPTAHDMAREYRVIDGLLSTDVPVAHAIALCRDESVLGAPFYLMSYVDGVVLDQPELLAALPAETATAACERLVDTLVALHDIDPAEVGLGDFGRPDGFLERQLRRWHKQWTASQTRPLPSLDEIVTRLNERLPTQSAPGIVHGDYRLTNVIFAPSLDRIAAVVDWEMATVGDPLTDVGLLVVYSDLAQDSSTVSPLMPESAGFLTGREEVERYAAESPRDLAAIDWYVAFGYFKLAVISEGIHHRYLAGKTVGAGFEHFGSAVPKLIAAALDTLAST